MSNLPRLSCLRVILNIRQATDERLRHSRAYGEPATPGGAENYYPPSSLAETRTRSRSMSVQVAERALYSATVTNTRHTWSKSEAFECKPNKFTLCPRRSRGSSQPFLSLRRHVRFAPSRSTTCLVQLPSPRILSSCNHPLADLDHPLLVPIAPPCWQPRAPGHLGPNIASVHLGQ